MSEEEENKVKRFDNVKRVTIEFNGEKQDFRLEEEKPVSEDVVEEIVEQDVEKKKDGFKKFIGDKEDLKKFFR